MGQGHHARLCNKSTQARDVRDQRGCRIQEKMRRKPGPFFTICIFVLALLFIFLALYYNVQYWQNYSMYSYGSMAGLSLKQELFIYAYQLVLVAAAIFLIVYRKKIYEKRKKLSLLAGTLITLFIILELFSRFYLCTLASPLVQSKLIIYGSGQCGVQSMYSPHPYLNYYGTPSYTSSDSLNMHNSLGYRGPEIILPKPQGVYRIVTIGGSSTYDTEIKDWHDDFARQLQQELQKKYNYSKIEVVNAGLGGWTTTESLINLEFKLLDIEPDLIIINHNANDLNLRFVNPSAYKSDNTGRIHQWKPNPVPLLFKSTLVRLATGINPVSNLGQVILNPKTGVNLVSTTGYVPQLNGTPMETLQKNKPVYFERNLESMVAIVRAHNVSVLLATWAHSSKKNDFAALPHWEYGFKEMNELIKKVGISHEVPVYDFAAEAPDEAEYWADGVHMNEEGAALKARLFAEFISANTLIDEKIPRATR